MPRALLTSLWAALVLLGAGSSQAQLFVVLPPALGFSGQTNSGPYSGSTDGSFAITPTAGSWFVSTTYGNPGPSIYVGPINSPGIGVLQITDGAGPFTLRSFDFSSNNGDTQYDIRGFLGSTLRYDETGTLPGTFGPFSFSTLTVTDADVAIDGLFIGLSPGFGVTSINLDNIAVLTVPEPQAIWLLSTVCIFLLGIRRKSVYRA